MARSIQNARRCPGGGQCCSPSGCEERTSGREGKRKRPRSGERGRHGKRTQRPLDANSLGTIRRRLFQMLDWAEGKASRDTTPMKRVIILRDQGKIPKNIANLMQTVLGFRNIAEYDDYVPTKKESDLITSAWEVVLEWHSANSKR